MTDGTSLPRGADGPRAVVWLGMAWLLAIEGMVVGALVTSWFFLRFHNQAWPPEGVSLPDLAAPAARTGLLVLAAVALRRAARGTGRGAVLGALLLGLPPVAAYVVLSARALAIKEYTWSAHAYGSIVWTLEGYGLLHALTLLGLHLAISGFLAFGLLSPERRVPTQVLWLYGAFTAASSALTWLTVNLAPNVMGR